MKKLVVMLALTLLAGLAAVQAAPSPPNLVGTWTYESECVQLDNTSPPTPAAVTRTETFEITYQDGNLFWGETAGVVCAAERPGCQFLFGALVGKEVYVTTWDSVTSGTVGKNGSEIVFVSQNQQYIPGAAPASCVGVATKTSP